MNEYTSKGGVARAHSDNGNLKDDGKHTFVFDYRNRLIAAFDKATNNPVAAYLYYCDGRRAKKIVYSQTSPGVVDSTVRFFYDGNQVVEETNDAGNTLVSWVYSVVYVDEPVQMVRSTAHPLGAGTFYLHQNARADVVAVTDSAGSVVERRLFDDFGRSFDGVTKAPVSGSAVGSPYGFQGRRLDAETGLYYFRARYYDPSTGRFVQRDPVWDPGNFGNQYSFVGGSPVSGVDPMGDQRQKPVKRMDPDVTPGRPPKGSGVAPIRPAKPPRVGADTLTGKAGARFRGQSKNAAVRAYWKTGNHATRLNKQQREALRKYAYQAVRGHPPMRPLTTPRLKSGGVDHNKLISRVAEFVDNLLEPDRDDPSDPMKERQDLASILKALSGNNERWVCQQHAILATALLRELGYAVREINIALIPKGRMSGRNPPYQESALQVWTGKGWTYSDPYWSGTSAESSPKGLMSQYGAYGSYRAYFWNKSTAPKWKDAAATTKFSGVLGADWDLVVPPGWGTVNVR